MRPLDALGVAAFLALGLAFYMALLYAPTELIQGEPQRIFYVHLPMVVVAYLSFATVFVASVLYLWKRRKIHDIVARSAAEIGVPVHDPGHRQRRALGPGHLGHLLAVGAAAYLHLRPLARVRRLPHAPKRV